jgi:hypothetical protein
MPQISITTAPWGAIAIAIAIAIISVAIRSRWIPRALPFPTEEDIGRFLGGPGIVARMVPGAIIVAIAAAFLPMISCVPKFLNYKPHTTTKRHT